MVFCPIQLFSFVTLKVMTSHENALYWYLQYSFLIRYLAHASDNDTADLAARSKKWWCEEEWRSLRRALFESNDFRYYTFSITITQHHIQTGGASFSNVYGFDDIIEKPL